MKVDGSFIGWPPPPTARLAQVHWPRRFAARRGGQPRGGHSEARNHIYITGKSGTGKSSLLFNLAETELTAGGGFLFIDPRGDAAHKLADAVLRMISTSNVPRYQQLNVVSGSRQSLLSQ
jgi:Mrp family chromosome partitioning ATPase